MNEEDFYLEMIDTYILGDKREVLAKEYAEESWEIACGTAKWAIECLSGREPVKDET